MPRDRTVHPTPDLVRDADSRTDSVPDVSGETTRESLRPRWKQVAEAGQVTESQVRAKTGAKVL